jgi:two-component system phosphate regulon sensor histidine kinase PhoR
MKQGIFQRIFLLFAVILVAAVICVELFITNAVRKNHLETLTANLTVQATLISREVPFDARAPLDDLCRSFKETTGARVTIIAPDGRVLGDSDTESSSMDNHAGRPEVQEAALSDAGTAIRHSDTLGHDLLYVAKKIEHVGGTRGFIRLSVPLKDVDAAVNQLRLKIIASVSVILLTAGLLFLRQMDRVRRLTEHVREFAASLIRGKLGHRLFLPRAGEFEDIAESLNTMALSLQGDVKALNDEKAKLETALLGISDGVLLLNHMGRVVLANRAFREMFGIQGDVEGKPFMEVIRNHVLAELVQNAHERRRTFSGEVEISFPKQTVVFATALPIVQESMREDTFSGTVVALHDITRLKLLERVRKDFVANVSHELKTPIAAIKGFSETLLDGALDSRKDAEKFVGIILNHSARLQRLVEDLLTLSRIELGEMQFVMQHADVRQMIENTMALMESKAREKDITVSQEIDPGLPPVSADADRIIQVLVNLLDNAVKFTPEGGSVRVSARAVPNAECGVLSEEKKGTFELETRNAKLDADFVEISVADTGPGIPPLLIPRLGERFYRVDPARSRELGGTGLGLAIVKHILQAHGSALKIENAPRRGTVVSFCLPVAL